MTAKQTRRCDMLACVQEFGRKHGKAFVASPSARDALALIATQLDEIKRVDTRGSRGGSGKNAARAALARAVTQVRRTARALAIDAPGVDARFTMPRSESDRALIGAAAAFAKQARPIARRFVAHGLPATFVDDLAARAAALARELQDRAEDDAVRTAARRAVDAALRTASAAVRRLDVIVGNVFEEGTGPRAEWKSARRVRRGRRKAVSQR